MKIVDESKFQIAFIYRHECKDYGNDLIYYEITRDPEPWPCISSCVNSPSSLYTYLDIAQQNYRQTNIKNGLKNFRKNCHLLCMRFENRFKTARSSSNGDGGNDDSNSLGQFNGGRNTVQPQQFTYFLSLQFVWVIEFFHAYCVFVHMCGRARVRSLALQLSCIRSHLSTTFNSRLPWPDLF